jgi:hypothetical protein
MLSSSFGFVDDHVGVIWRDLQSEHNSHNHTDTKTSMKPSLAESCEPVYSFPCPPAHSPTSALFESSGSLRHTSANGGVSGPSLPHVVSTSMLPKRGQMTNLDELPRLVHRNRAFHQSSSKVYIKHNHGTRIYKLLRFNWFHVFLRWPTKWSLLTLLSVWSTLIVLFGIIYTSYDNIQLNLACGLGRAGSPITFAGAFAFSLETCTTVGYTFPYNVNAFFKPECSGLQVIIYFQTIWSMIFNAFFAYLLVQSDRSQ